MAILQTICEYPHPQEHFEGDALSWCDGGIGTGRDGGGGMDCDLLGTGTGRDGGGGMDCDLLGTGTGRDGGGGMDCDLLGTGTGRD